MANLIELIQNGTILSPDLEEILRSTRDITNAKNNNPILEGHAISDYLTSKQVDGQITKSDIDVIRPMLIDDANFQLLKQFNDGVAFQLNYFKDKRLSNAFSGFVPQIHEALRTGSKLSASFNPQTPPAPVVSQPSIMPQPPVINTPPADYVSADDFNNFKNDFNSLKSDVNNFKTDFNTRLSSQVNSLGDYVKNSDLDSRINSILSAKAPVNQSQTSVNSSNLDDFVSSDIFKNALIAVNKNLDSLKEMINKRYTKAEVDNIKSELNSMINNLGNGISDVEIDLNNYKNDNDAVVNDLKSNSYNKSEVNALLNDKSYLKQFIIDELNDPDSDLFKALTQMVGKDELDDSLDAVLANPSSKVYQSLKKPVSDLDNKVSNIEADVSELKSDVNTLNDDLDNLVNFANSTRSKVTDLANDFTALKSEFDNYKDSFNDFISNLDTRISEQLESGVMCKSVLMDLLNGYATTGDLTALNTDFSNYKNSLKIVLNGIDSRINDLDLELSDYVSKYDVLDEFIGNALNDIDSRIGSINSYDPAVAKALIQSELSAGNYVNASDLQTKLDAINLSLSADESAKLSDLMNISTELKTASETILGDVKAYSEGVIKTYETVSNTYTEVKNFITSLVTKASEMGAKAPVSA